MAELPIPDSLRVVIADDHPFYRQGLARLLRSKGIEVVGEAPNGEAAIRAVVETAPDLLIMDLNMPGVSGLEATRHLSQHSPDTRVLVLSVSAQEADVSQAILAGANGYVLKDEPPDEILAAIKTAASGESTISTRTARVLLRSVEDSIAAGDETAGGGLSVVELEVLQLLAEGKTRHELAEALALAPSAVGGHISSILGKLQLQQRVIAAAKATRRRSH